METNKSVLIVDDDSIVRDFLSDVLEDEDFTVTTAESVSQAKVASKKGPYDMVITDIQMDDGSGFEVAREFNINHPGTAVMLITAYIDDEKIQEAKELNISSFLTKPFTDDQIRTSVNLCLQQQESAGGFQTDSDEENLGIIGQSAYIQDIRDQVRRVALGDIPVLVLGPSGTGKEVIVHAIHHLSQRGDKSMRVVNCAAIPKHLEEAELFGTTRGAYTGATRDRPGIIMDADGSTLFLDEIGELSLGTQAKLLRVIDNEEILRIGETVPRKVSIRVLCATNRDLEEMVKTKAFREDLFYRLKGYVIRTQPLTEHVEDIPYLVHHFIKCEAGENAPKGISRDAMAYLTNHDWNGNIRELKQVVRLLCHHAGNAPRINIATIETVLNKPFKIDTGFALSYKKSKERVLREFEMEFFTRLLQKYQGNVSSAAREAQLDRSNIMKKLKYLEINPDTFRKQNSEDDSE